MYLLAKGRSSLKVAEIRSEAKGPFKDACRPIRKDLVTSKIGMFAQLAS